VRSKEGLWFSFRGFGDENFYDRCDFSAEFLLFVARAFFEKFEVVFDSEKDVKR